MRIVFFGSPAVAVRPLEALVNSGHDVILVVTGPDRRRGRGSATTPTPVKAAALELGLPVTDDLADVIDSGAELGVVVAYGRLIPDEILERIPLVNIHFSLLPRWRGAAPVERALLAGDTKTGVCLMEVVSELDAGGVYASRELEITDTDTASDLTGRLGDIGTDLLVDLLRSDLPRPVPQDEESVTYAHKMTNRDRELDATMATDDVLRRVRVGGAWTTIAGQRLKVLDAAARPADSSDTAGAMESELGTVVDGPGIFLRDGVVDLITVQPAGRAAMIAADWARGTDVVGGRIGT